MVIKLREIIQLEQKKFDDDICCDFSISSGELERTILWTTYGMNQIGGSICINFKSGHGNIFSVFGFAFRSSGKCSTTIFNSPQLYS
ncbi:S-Ena type endospore appendage [Lysinibacillus sp. NPDC093712]|uniref:S-Ena type endospore appendage n=1 Tax=Lysinibacillus sp. NPDC093712 TaxID=3390579 RepID=UPI003D059C02